MKKIFVCLALLALLPLRADDFIPNGDFSQGTTGWSGKFQQASTPATGGITMQLKPQEWTTLSQDIDVKAHRLHFTLIYSLSADATFSSNQGDLAVAGQQAGLKFWQKMDNRPGYAGIYLEGDGLRTSGMIPFTPKTGTIDKQSVRNPFGFRDDDNKRTLTIAFPPGTGTVTIYQATGTGSAAEPSPFANEATKATSMTAEGGDQDVTSVPPAPADDLIKNGDFSDGMAHWSGDLHPFANMNDPTLSTLPAAPASGTGGYFDLHKSDLLKVSQVIDVKTPRVKLSVTYALSSDTMFSKEPADYSELMAAGRTVGDPTPFIGSWGILTGNADPEALMIYFIPTHPSGTGMRTTTKLLYGVKSGETRREVEIAFPAGKGTVVIYRISAEPAKEVDWFH